MSYQDFWDTGLGLVITGLVVMVVVVLLLVLVVGVPAGFLARQRCINQCAMMDIECRWSLSTLCMVEHQDAWVPFDHYRWLVEPISP